MRLVNIFNKFRDLYLFIRNEQGELDIVKKKDFFPYFYENDPQGNFKSFTGNSLRKIMISSPHEITKKRTDNAWEGDLLFTKRFMIDRIKEMEKTKIKYSFVDIEVLADEFPDVQKAKCPVSCISVYNSELDKIESFYLGNFDSEFHMIESFINYMKQERFDLWLSWNVKFDYNYLYYRYPEFDKAMSIIGENRYGDGEIFYPAGISIVDYLTWFKKVTLNKEKQYTLDHIAQKYLKTPPKPKVDFSKLSPELLQHNIEDVQKLADLEKEKKLIPYFDEVRRLAKVEWEDLIWNSRIIDSLLLQEAKNQKVALPMKPHEMRGTLSEKEDFQGAYREVYKKGSFTKGVGEYDLGSAYPYAIVDFCLDSANIIPMDYDPDFKADNIFPPLSIETTVFQQNPNALLPTVVKKLLTLKVDIKNKLETLKLDTPEYKDMKQKYEAIKSIVNSAYGVFGNRFFRLYDKRVASATTFIVRSLLHYVKDKLEEKGYPVIYVDTDAVFIESNENLTDLCNQLVKDWAKEKFNKDHTNIEFEYKGNFEKLLILAKCRYIGYIRTKKGLEEQVKGVEAKRKDSTVFMKKFQRTLIDKILDEEPKEDIFRWIKNQMIEIKQAPLQDIAFPCRLAKDPDTYKNKPIFVRAIENTPEFKTKIGNSFYYIYVNPLEKININTIIKLKGHPETEPIELKENLSRIEGVSYLRKKLKLPELSAKEVSVLHKKDKPKDVLAFSEDVKDHINKDCIDWKRIIERNITMKLSTIFEAMGWDTMRII